MLYSILIGGLAGWLAGKLMKGGGFGILINILLGIGGGLLANWLFSTFNVNFIDGWVGDLLKGVIGSAVILFIAGLFKK